MEIKYNRKDYMEGKVSHDEYYAQFVTKSTCWLICNGIGKQAIINSTDPHFNDIPLAQWDRLANLIMDGLAALAKSNASTHGGKPSLSLSDKVCLLKAAARHICNNPESFF